MPAKITGYTVSTNPVKLNATSTICYHCYKYFQLNSKGAEGDNIICDNEGVSPPLTQARDPLTSCTCFDACFLLRHLLHALASMLVNPRHACAARVTALGLCVCVCLLLNISLYMGLFVPQTIATFPAEDEGRIF